MKEFRRNIVLKQVVVEEKPRPAWAHTKFAAKRTRVICTLECGHVVERRVNQLQHCKRTTCEWCESGEEREAC